MLASLPEILQQECNLHPQDLLLVGVSGGPDSLCLLHILHQSGYTLVAAHLNHKLRPEADDEARAVSHFASGMGVKFISGEADVTGYANEHSLSIEEAARRARYQFLFQQAEYIGAHAVLVGHTADDQVETILMHLMRGSGLVGLTGMQYRALPNPWSGRVPLLRPLLSTWRVEIMEYLSQKELTPAMDASNFDQSYFRNRVRHDLLPILEGYNPGIRQNLLSLGQILRDDLIALEGLVDEAWKSNLVRQADATVAFSRSGFQQLPPSIQRYFIRRAIAQHMPGLRDIDFECIERGITFIQSQHTVGQVDLLAGLRLILEGDLVLVIDSDAELPVSEFPMLSPGETITLNFPSLVPLNAGWQLLIKETHDISQAIQQSSTNADLYQTWVDIGSLNQPLVLRCRTPGDRIRPVGMGNHSVKVADLMINLKLPRRARRTWPLVCSNDEVLWVPGYRLSELLGVRPASTMIYHLHLFRNLAT